MQPRQQHLKVLSCLLVVLAIGPDLLLSNVKAAAQGKSEDDIRSKDVCDHLPTPPGKANGIDKRCPPAGSSSGVVKGDFNGDGFADLAIGEPDATIGGAGGTGDVFILYGSASGVTTTESQIWDEANLGISVGAGDSFGAALASGDFNGDGYSDLAIGIPNRSVTTVGLFGIKTVHNNAGAIAVIYGSKNGLTPNGFLAPQFFDLEIMDQLLGESFSLDGAHFGISLAWGNFNGDKTAAGNDIGDLAIGAPGTNNQNLLFDGTPSNAGAAFVIFGDGIGGLASQAVEALDETSFLFPATSGDQFGSALTAGDFNGDHVSDLVIGAIGSPVDFRTAGAVFVIPGQCCGGTDFVFDNPLIFTPDILVGTPEDNEQFGSALAAGDFNGDGKSDLAIGVRHRTLGNQSGAGVVSVLYGAKDGSGLTTAGNQLWSLSGLGNAAHVNEAGAQFGRTLATGDFNGDGNVDLAIGVPFKNITVNRNGSQTVLVDAGEVDVVYGSPSGLSLSAVRGPQFWNQDLAIQVGRAHPGNHFGASLTAWNFGRNDFRRICIAATCISLPVATADLAIGVPFEEVDNLTEAGAVDVIYGSFGSNGLTSGGTELTDDSIGIPPIAFAHFGAALY
jgi:hypothetical protein